MGKQSARLYYDGNDHKDIFFRGKYHRAMYLGSELLWEKLPSEKYFLYKYNDHPRVFDVESHVLTDYVEYVAQSDDDDAYGNNLYTSVGGNLFTHDGKNFFEHNIDEEFRYPQFNVLNGYTTSITIGIGRIQHYYIETDKNVNELSRHALFETLSIIGGIQLVPCYPYYYEYLIYARPYDATSYYSTFQIRGKHGGYLLEYSASGQILFVYCDQTRNFIFTNTGNMYVFNNGSVQYRINVPSRVYACLRYKGKYILYVHGTDNRPLDIYQTTNFTDIERINSDYLEFENTVNPSIPYILILNGDSRSDILKNYDDCYYYVLRAFDIRNQLTQTTMFADGKRENFDCLLLRLNFIRSVDSVTRKVYIDNLLFEDSDKNYVYFD